MVKRWWRENVARKFSFPLSSSRNTIVSLSSRIKKNFISSRNCLPSPSLPRTEGAPPRYMPWYTPETSFFERSCGRIWASRYRIRHRFQKNVCRKRKKEISIFWNISCVVSSSLLRAGKWNSMHLHLSSRFTFISNCTISQVSLKELRKINSINSFLSLAIEFSSIKVIRI